MGLDLTDLLHDEQLSLYIEHNAANSEQCRKVWQTRYKVSYPYKYMNEYLEEFIPQWWRNDQFH